MRLFATRRATLRSQVPLTALMVVYTFVSLSILAEPIVERPAPPSAAAAEGVAVPADAVIPVAGDGRLERVEPGTHAKAKLTYRLLGSAFHDGTRTANAPASGANSFTEGQAKSRIEAAGFTNVSDLKKDDQGVWRGQAQKDGRQVSVALDYQGNVTTR